MVDIAHVTDEQFAEIEHALFRHKMIYFCNQRIGHAEQHAFSRRFGDFAEDAYTDGVPGFREVQPLIKEADDRSAMVFGSGWHTDSPFLDEPPAITMLRSVETPPYGGDTMWANAALAWRMLDDAERDALAGLKVHFSMRDVLASAQANAEQRDSPIGSSPPRATWQSCLKACGRRCWAMCIRWSAPMRAPASSPCTSTLPTASASTAWAKRNPPRCCRSSPIT